LPCGMAWRIELHLLNNLRSFTTLRHSLIGQ